MLDLQSAEGAAVCDDAKGKVYCVDLVLSKPGRVKLSK